MIALAAFLAFTFIWTFRDREERATSVDYDYKGSIVQEPVLLDDGILRGVATAPKLENATLK
jgi:FAD-linked sulfhydryl oxidase